MANLGVENTKAQNKVAEEVYKAQADMARTQVSAAASKYAADKAQNTISGIVATLMQDDPSLTKSEATRRAYVISNPGFGSIEQRDVASQRAAINAQIVKLEGTPAYSTEDKAAKTRKLAALTQQLNAINAGTGTADSAGAPSANTVSFSQLNPG